MSSLGPRRRWILLGAVLFLAAIVAPFFIVGLNGRGQPESELLYPGSVVVTRYGSADESSVMAGSMASVDDILAYFRREAEQRGYLFGGGSARIPMSTESFVCAWHNDTRILRLAFINPDALARYMVVPSGFQTLYEWSVINETAPLSGRPCNILLDGDPVPS